MPFKIIEDNGIRDDLAEAQDGIQLIAQILEPQKIQNNLDSIKTPIITKTSPVKQQQQIGDLPVSAGEALPANTRTLGNERWSRIKRLGGGRAEPVQLPR